MVINVVGERPVNFKDQKTGNEVSGKSIYYLYEDSNVKGLAADKCFVSSNFVNPFEVGKSYQVVYNRYGRFDYSNVKECVN